MSNVSSVTNFFSTANEGFATTLGSTISSGATTVPLAGTSGLTNGTIFVGIIEPGAANQQVFTGTVDISGSSIDSVVWTRGSNNSHAGGVQIVDYVTGTDWNMMSAGILKEHLQSGKHGAITPSSVTTTSVTASGSVTAASFVQTGANPSNGWTSGLATPSTVAYNGNHSYTITINTTDITGTITPGMRLLMTRTVTAPTQSTLLNGSSQYYQKSSPAGMTFTDKFVVSAWIKLTAYAAGEVASRYNGTSGWRMQINSNGQIFLIGYNASGSNYSQVYSYQSVPLNKWVHVAAQLDMADFTATTTTSYVMIDGINVPASVSRAGTNPTALIQAGNLEIGSYNGGTEPFPGALAQVAIYSAQVTQANIVKTISQTLAGTETSLISAYSFNNSINDLNANANNLTAEGSAVATNADTPFTQTYAMTGYTNGAQNYGIVKSCTFSTNTTMVVQVPGGDTIPTTGGVSAVSYSVQASPYGFPVYNTKLVGQALGIPSTTISAGSVTDIPGLSVPITVPVTGQAYKAKIYIGSISAASGSPPAINIYITDQSNNYYATLQLQLAGANYQVQINQDSPELYLPTTVTALKARIAAGGNATINTLNSIISYFLKVEEA